MTGGGVAAPQGKKKARIEIIPLIDVVFFLLATFVLFTLSLNRIKSVPVNLPVASPPSQTKDPEEPVIIQVSDVGTVYWNRELIGMAEVTPRLIQYKSSTQNPRILVSGDDRAKFGPTIQVLDEIRNVGIAQVSIETAYRGAGK